MEGPRRRSSKDQGWSWDLEGSDGEVQVLENWGIGEGLEGTGSVSERAGPRV